MPTGRRQAGSLPDNNILLSPHKDFLFARLSRIMVFNYDIEVQRLQVLGISRLKSLFQQRRLNGFDMRRELLFTAENYSKPGETRANVAARSLSALSKSLDNVIAISIKLIPNSG
jgi:hypothetical protein